MTDTKPEPNFIHSRGMKFPDDPTILRGRVRKLLRQNAYEAKESEAALRVVREGDRISFGPFDLEFVAVNHSIPDALAVAIRTGAGMVLHTGDFKMDQFPLDKRITDLRGFSRLADEGIDLLLIDSTNAEVLTKLAKDHEIAQVILDYRALIKLVNTYTQVLRDAVSSEGRVHCNLCLLYTSDAADE